MSGPVGCPTCGRPIETTAAFCATCGTAVAPWAVQGPQQAAPPPPPARSGAHPALIVALVVAVVLAIGAVAAVALVAAGGESDPKAAAAAPPVEVRTVVDERRAEPAPPERKTYERGAYTITLPTGWVVQTRAEDRGSYIESVWRSPTNRDTTLLVDHTPGYDGSPESGARTVRAMTSRSEDYREVAFGPTRLDGRSAWRWEFEVGGVRKVDYFLVACGTGYAILGAAPPSAFSSHSEEFRRAAASLRPEC